MRERVYEAEFSALQGRMFLQSLDSPGQDGRALFV
jgi:hypothetical protein